MCNNCSFLLPVSVFKMKNKHLRIPYSIHNMRRYRTELNAFMVSDIFPGLNRLLNVKNQINTFLSSYSVELTAYRARNILTADNRLDVPKRV